MSKEKSADKSKRPTVLRKRAEEMLKTSGTDIARMPTDDVAKLVHEFQIHQMELEIQNEELREAQIGLARSRDRYSDLYEFAPVGQLTLDRHGVIQDANLTAAAMLGVERKRLDGRAFHELVAGDAQEVWHLHCREVFSDERKRICELETRKPDRTRLIIRLVSLAFRDEEGELSRCRSALVDVTEQHQTRKEVRQLNETLEKRIAERTAELQVANDQLRRTQFTVDNSQDAIFWIREDGGLLFVNDSACHVTGYGRDELLTMSVADLDADLPASQWPAFWEDFKTGAPVLVERRLRTSGGRIVPVEFSPTHLKFDHTDFVCVFLRDISRRKDAEDERLEIARILDDSVNEIYVFDAESLKLLQVNRGARRNLGYSMEELHERTPVDLKPDYSLEKFTRLIRPLRDGETASLAFETRHQRKDGSLYDVEVHLQRAEYRGISCFAAIILDITRRKESEQELHIKDKAIDAAAAGIVITDPAGIITYANPAFVRMWGYESTDEIIGRSNTEFSSSEQDIDEVMESLREIGSWVGERIGKKRDGTFFAIEIATSAVSDRCGEVICLMASFIDISDRKETEQALRNADEFNKNLIATAQSVILVLDPEGRIVRYNPLLEELTGWKLSETKGRDWMNTFLPARDRKRIRKLFTKAISGKATRGNVNIIVTRDGAELQMEWNDACLTDADGNLVGLLCTGTDVTERLQLEQEVVYAAEEERQRISQDLHDDLGSHLTGIDFRVKSLANSASKLGGAKLVKDVMAIKDLVQDAIRKTRTLAKGLHPVGTYPEDLMSALKELADGVRKATTFSCQFRCRESVEIDDPIVANHLFRIAQESVNNAVKYSGGSRITVSLKNAHGKTVLGINDNGIGFDHEQKRTSGLGLHILKYRATAIGGSLVIARRKKSGTRITCTLPQPPRG